MRRDSDLFTHKLFLRNSFRILGPQALMFAAFPPFMAKLATRNQHIIKSNISPTVTCLGTVGVSEFSPVNRPTGVFSAHGGLCNGEQKESYNTLFGEELRGVSTGLLGAYGN